MKPPGFEIQNPLPGQKFFHRSVVSDPVGAPFITSPRSQQGRVVFS
jgi:hypothetical protein